MRLPSRSFAALGLAAALVALTGCDLVSRLKAMAGGDADGGDAGDIVVVGPDAAAVAVAVGDAAAAPLATATVAPVVPVVPGTATPRAQDAGARVADAGTPAPVPTPTPAGTDAGVPTPRPTFTIPTAIPGFDAGAWKPPAGVVIPTAIPRFNQQRAPK